MRDHELDRILLGVLSAAIRAQRNEVKKRVAEYGRRERMTKRAIARLDELREAHSAVSVRHGDEATLRRALSYLVTSVEEDGRDLDLALDLARRALRSEEPPVLPESATEGQP